MRVRIPGWRSGLATLVLMAAAAAATYGALAALGIGGGQAQAPQVSRGPALLGWSNRDHLAICVRGVGVSAAEEAEVTGLVRQALPAVMEHPGWATLSAGLPPPTVDNDCPAEPVVYSHFRWMTDPADPSKQLRAVAPRRVSIPDKHVLLVFVLPKQQLVLLREQMPGFTSFFGEEMICPNDLCYGATQGMYVSLDEARDAAFLISSLQGGLLLNVLWEEEQRHPTGGGVRR